MQERRRVLACLVLGTTFLATGWGQVDDLRKRAQQGDAQAQFEYGKYLVGSQSDGAGKWLLRAAEQGHPEAARELGFLYRDGKGGVKRNSSSMLKWLTVAGESGDSVAQQFLEDRYFKGSSWSQALRWVKMLAEGGRADSQYRLGWMYRTGSGTPSNPVEARRWFHEAAVQGHVPAQYNLSMMFYEGVGGEKDPGEAVRWWKEAAANPQVSRWRDAISVAQYELARAYHQGSGGLTRNDIEAVKWWHLAAANGFSRAYYNLGVAYAQAFGVRQDLVTAYAWFSLAGEKADNQSNRELANKAINLVGADLTQEQLAEGKRRGREWREKPPAEVDPAALQETGVGTREDSALSPEMLSERARAAYDTGDYTRALADWTTLADLGDSVAEYGIGVLHAQGLGVEKSETQALSWFRRSAGRGFEPAMVEVGRASYNEGRTGEALKWWEKVLLSQPGDEEPEDSVWQQAEQLLHQAYRERAARTWLPGPLDGWTAGEVRSTRSKFRALPTGVISEVRVGRVFERTGGTEQLQVEIHINDFVVANMVDVISGDPAALQLPSNQELHKNLTGAGALPFEYQGYPGLKAVGADGRELMLLLKLSSTDRSTRSLVLLVQGVADSATLDAYLSRTNLEGIVAAMAGHGYQDAGVF